MVNTLTGQALTAVGSMNGAINAVIGPGVLYNTANANSSTAPIATANTAITMACILQFVAVSGSISQYIICDNNQVSILCTNNGPIKYFNGGSFISSGFTPVAGVPYFIAMSCNGTLVKFLIVNLNTGAVTSASASSTISNPGTPVHIGGLAGGNTSNAYLAAAMVSQNNYLQATDFSLWAADIWPFWYPDVYDDFIVGSSFVPPPGPGPNFLTSMMPMMGVG